MISILSIFYAALNAIAMYAFAAVMVKAGIISFERQSYRYRFTKKKVGPAVGFYVEDIMRTKKQKERS